MRTAQRLIVMILLQLVAHSGALAASRLGFASTLGGGQWDAIRAVATDAGGNIYVAGETYSGDFPPVAGGSARPSSDAFVLKLDSTGAQVLYAVLLAGSGYESARGLAVDSGGNAYVTGVTTSQDFPVSVAAFQRRSASPGLEDAFAVKLSRTGAIEYATYLGGSGADVGFSIAVGQDGRAYLSGSTGSTNFPATRNASGALFRGGGSDCFVASLEPSGSTLWYAAYLGGAGLDACKGVAVNAAGEAVVVGSTRSSDFPLRVPFQASLSGSHDAFVAKLSRDGGSLLFSTYLGGAGVDEASAVRFDARGLIYIAGYTASAGFPVTPSAPQRQLRGDYDGFSCAIAADGSKILWATYLGGSESDQITSLFVAPDGHVVVAGVTSSSDFPLKDPFQSSFGGVLDAFIAAFEPAGSRLVFASYLGAAGDDRAHAVASLGAGKAVFAGQFMPDGARTVEQRYWKTSPGQYDGFLAVVSYADPPPALRFVPVTPCRLVDTRNAAGPFGGPQIPGGSVRSFVVPNGGCGVPAGARAYSFNVAVVPRGPLGYVSVWPAGEAQPTVSILNSLDGRIKSSAAIVPAGVGGAIAVFASDSTHVAIDVSGYFVDAADPAGLAFYPLSPCRAVDTRGEPSPLGGPALAAGQIRAFPLRSACELPAVASAYALNLAAVPKGSLGYLTAWPSGRMQPVSASLNAPTGAVTATAVILPAGDNGSISLFASDATGLVIDVNGYFAPPGPGGLSLYAITPCRALDTRLSPGFPFTGKMDVPVGGGSCAAPPADAYVFNATVVPAYSLGYLTLWASAQQQPATASLNALDGAITSNLAIVPAAAGRITAFASDSTHLVLDLLAYFAP